MGPVIPVIMIGMAVASAAMQFQQQRAAANNESKIAAIQAKQAVEQTNAQYAEIDRQEREVNRIAEEQRSDRMRTVRSELGTMRVLAGERGASDATTNALLGEVGYLAGLDLSRIEQNRKANIEAGEASKRAAQQGALNTIDIAKNQISVANKTIGLSLIGTGIQIAGAVAGQYNDYQTKQAQLEAAKSQAD